MAFLIIAGIVVPIADSSEPEPELVGVDSRTYGGGMRTTVASAKRQWSFTTKSLLITASEQLRSAVALGALVLCSGDGILDGVTAVSCRVLITETKYVLVRGGHRRVMTLSLIQV